MFFRLYCSRIKLSISQHDPFILVVGFLVTATSMEGEHVNGTLVEFAQRYQHHDSKQPLLAVFTEDEMRTLLATTDDGKFLPELSKMI